MFKGLGLLVCVPSVPLPSFCFLLAAFLLPSCRRLHPCFATVYTMLPPSFLFSAASTMLPPRCLYYIPHSCCILADHSNMLPYCGLYAPSCPFAAFLPPLDCVLRCFLQSVLPMELPLMWPQFRKFYYFITSCRGYGLFAAQVPKFAL